MHRYTKKLLLVAICLGSLLSCATDPQVRRYQIGEVSRTTAETAYQAIYVAYKDGQISAEDMDVADHVYRTWQNAQRRYVDQARRGSGDLSGANLAVQQALAQLLVLVADAQAL